MNWNIATKSYKISREGWENVCLWFTLGVKFFKCSSLRMHDEVIGTTMFAHFTLLMNQCLYHFQNLSSLWGMNVTCWPQSWIDRRRFGWKTIIRSSIMRFIINSTFYSNTLDENLTSFHFVIVFLNKISLLWSLKIILGSLILLCSHYLRKRTHIHNLMYSHIAP